MNIYVGNLSYDLNDSELQQLFEEHGPVVSVNVINDRDTGRSKGFAFIEMENQADGENAIRELDGTLVKGRNIKVNQARPRNDKPRGGGGGGGGYGGGHGGGGHGGGGGGRQRNW